LLIRQSAKLKKLAFGPDYILPKPFDPRLAERVPQAVAKAALKKPVVKKTVVKKPAKPDAAKAKATSKPR
jgi:malate dehydrogenase (oxaloacetate-decarboxylating)(NADP+)